MALRGMTGIVTGAAGGIGSATARAFAAQGANLVLTDTSSSGLDVLATELRTGGAAVCSIAADITRREDIDRVVAAAMRTFGRVDILANIAGVSTSPSLCDASDQELERVVMVNLLGCARTMHAVLPIMKSQRSGSIINVGSVAGEAGIMGIYSASKFGLRGLSDSVRREVRSCGINVSLIEPGFVRTSFNAAMKGKLPGPVIVADAILNAIRRPRRRRVVPAWYYVPVFLVNAFPGLTDLVFGDARIQDRLNEDARTPRSATANATQRHE
jgi:NAD(P)-dependent dehydrogenase (short-subunit alcohol dehydrogenase family)